MNIIKKIIQAHTENINIKSGDIVDVYPDFIMSHDGDNIYNILSFNNDFKAKKVFNRHKIVIGIDHNVPSDSLNTAKTHSKMREFACRQLIEQFHDNEGVMHQIMIENYIKPYQLIFAADSHAGSYGGCGALGIPIGTLDNAYLWAEGKTWLEVPQIVKIKIEGKLPLGVYAKDIVLSIIHNIETAELQGKIAVFIGETVRDLSESSRIVICNMIIEGGAYSAIVDVQADINDGYDYLIEVDFLKPEISCPHSPRNVKNIEEIGGIKVTQIFLGSCTNGRSEDFAIAASIIKRHKVAKSVRFYICPASQKQLMLALEKGYIQILLKAGAILLSPGCSMCFGSCQGIMDDNETLFSTGNRNYQGRVGSRESKIYLGSPATAAATAITGKIEDCRAFL